MKASSPHVIWAGASVFIALIVGTTILAMADKDVMVVLTAVAVVTVTLMNALGALLWGKVNEVKELANGNLSRTSNQVDDQNRQLRQMNQQLLNLLAQTHPGIVQDSKPVGDGVTEQFRTVPVEVRRP